MRKVYADNAATSKEKPEQVWQAMEYYLKEIGTSPGRGGYSLGLEADRLVFAARQKIMRLFNGKKQSNVFFSLNVTHALNTVLKGFLKKGDHVVTTSMEHNALARPLKYLEELGIIDLTIVQCSEEGYLFVNDLQNALKPQTRMIALTHASNVTGTIMPVKEIGEIAREKGIFYVIDCAQTAGVLPIDFEELHADVLAFTGHKGLLGPSGTGGCYLSERAAQEISSFVQGGTGSRSDLLVHPDFMPDKFESGTPNTLGIAGLNAALDWLLDKGVSRVREHEVKLTGLFIQGLQEINKKMPGKIKIYGPQDPLRQTAVISVNFAGYDAGEISFILDRMYGIMTRSGLHCAPLAHQTIGSFPEGTLRFSFGFFSTEEEVAYILESIQKLLKG